MKTLLALALLCALVFFVGTYNAKRHQHEPFNRNRPANLQEQSTHMLGIMYSSESEHPMGYCTGTAIGPHAILSAAHCNKGQGIQLDSVQHTYNITKVLKDGRDHVIFLVDGPALYSIEPYEARYPVIGEPVDVYGDGGRQYPAVHKTGIVLDEYDPSEVDAAAGFFYCSVHSIPGDSGSAVYGKDGKIIGIVTYGIEEDAFFSRTHMGGFALNFTPEQIAEAQTYSKE